LVVVVVVVSKTIQSSLPCDPTARGQQISRVPCRPSRMAIGRTWSFGPPSTRAGAAGGRPEVTSMAILT
jgi:hypothetical protein